MKKLFLIGILILPLWVVAQASPEGNDKLAAASGLYRAQKYEDAMRDFLQANKELGGRCVGCLLGAAHASVHLGHSDDVLKFSSKALEFASTPEEQFEANLEGCTLLLQINHSPQGQAEAEERARKAVELQPASVAAHSALGMALLRQSKDDAGIAAMKWVESHIPDGPFKDSVRAVIADPRRARMVFAPNFTAKTSDGKQITLTELKGKVVLLDFWATWCPVCRASIPEIKDLLKKYGSDRLVVLSISADSKQPEWTEYVSRHEMTWPQSWDNANKSSVARAFGVHAFPTYILLDGEGVVRERIDGLREQQTLTYRLHGELEKLMK